MQHPTTTRFVRYHLTDADRRNADFVGETGSSPTHLPAQVVEIRDGGNALVLRVAGLNPKCSPVVSVATEQESVSGGWSWPPRE